MKKKNNWLKNILIISFIIFMSLFIASESGFYESKLSNKVALTTDALKRFESDVLNGEEVDLNTYIVSEVHDYSNAFTKSGDKFSEVAVKIITDGINSIWDTLKVLFF